MLRLSSAHEFGLASENNEICIENDNEIFHGLPRVDINMQQFDTSCLVARNYNLGI